jgi:hypothetical protein
MGLAWTPPGALLGPCPGPCLDPARGLAWTLPGALLGPRPGPCWGLAGAFDYICKIKNATSTKLTVDVFV